MGKLKRNNFRINFSKNDLTSICCKKGCHKFDYLKIKNLCTTHTYIHRHTFIQTHT